MPLVSYNKLVTLENTIYIPVFWYAFINHFPNWMMAPPCNLELPWNGISRPHTQRQGRLPTCKLMLSLRAACPYPTRVVHWREELGRGYLLFEPLHGLSENESLLFVKLTHFDSLWVKVTNKSASFSDEGLTKWLNQTAFSPSINAPP